MTYYLQGGEIVEARVASNPTEVAGAKLQWLGVQVYRSRDGGVMGQIALDPAQLESLDGVRVDRIQRFKVVSEDHLQVLPPSPLSRCRAVRFMDAQSHEELAYRISSAWAEVVAAARRTLDRARTLAQDAHLLMDPWRIEGTLQVGGDDVRVLFSAAGDRACVCGLNGRALVVQPVAPRIIIPVQSEASREEHDQLWRSAIEQARTCVGRQPEPVSEQMSLSIDLASQDLEASYGVVDNTGPAHAGPPGTVGPGHAAAPPVITGTKMSPPPRMPPPRPASSPGARPNLSVVPPPAAAAPPLDSLDLGSLDLSSADLSLDLATVDLPD